MYWIFIFIFILVIFHNHGIPIFLYHQVHPGSKVNPELLEQHLLWLSKKGYHSMTLSEYMEEGAPKKTDRKSTRLNSSHANISYAVFCLKKKKSQAEDTIISFTYTSIIRSTILTP